MSDPVFVRRHADYLNELERLGYKQKSFGYLIPDRAITTAEQAIIAERIDKKGDDDADLGCGRDYAIVITKNYLRRLSGGGEDNSLWMNDELVNLYCALCNRRYDDDSTVYMHLTFFYSRMMQGGEYKYSNVPEIFNQSGRRRGKVDVLEKRALVIPVNLGGSHWIVCFADMYFKCLYALDSMRGADTYVVLQNILQYLEDEFRDKKKIKVNKSEWTVLPAGANSTPKQTNSDDCGVFTCMFANVLTEYFARQAKAKEFRRVDMDIFDVIRAGDMTRLRQQIQLDLLSGKVYSRPSD